MVRTHTVVAGETLSALALRFYGDAELYRLIATASGVADPDVIDVGQRLIFPDFTRYTVVAGDTLSALALRFYGDASFYPPIATVNSIADPSVIDVGQASQLEVAEDIDWADIARRLRTDRCRDRQHSALLRGGGACGRIAPRRPRSAGGGHPA
jgi:LysM repeat protein